MVISELFRIGGVSAYHTSILVGDKEFYFDGCGIERGAPFASHMLEDAPAAQAAVEVKRYGKTALTGSALMLGLRRFFEPGTYDIICKNCNSFTDVALYFLTRKRLDPRYSRLERLFQAMAPLSTGALNGLARGIGRLRPDGGHEAASGSRPWSYATNPAARGFSVEKVIAECDASDRQSGLRSGGPLCGRRAKELEGCWGAGPACCERAEALSVCCERTEALALDLPSVPCGLVEVPSPRGEAPPANAVGRAGPEPGTRMRRQCLV